MAKMVPTATLQSRLLEPSSGSNSTTYLPWATFLVITGCWFSSETITLTWSR